MPSPAAIDAASTGQTGDRVERPVLVSDREQHRAHTGRGRHQDHPRRAGHRWRLGQSRRRRQDDRLGLGVGRGPGPARGVHRVHAVSHRAAISIRCPGMVGSGQVRWPDGHGTTTPAARRGVIHTAPAQGPRTGNFADGVAVAALNPDGVDGQYAARRTVGHLPWTSINASHCSCLTSVFPDATNQRSRLNCPEPRAYIRCGTSPCKKKPWRGSQIPHAAGPRRAISLINVGGVLCSPIGS